MNAAFISYSHVDEKALDRLHKHLVPLKREGTLTTWSDHAIVAGDRLSGVIDAQLAKSNLFIALLSPDYLASRYCYDTEFKQALTLEAAGRMRIVPVILEPCDWQNSPFKDFLALPKDGQPVASFTNANIAYLNIVTGLRAVLALPKAGRAAASAALGAAPPAGARRPRIKQDFDTIQRSEFADNAFKVISDYFEASCRELTQFGEDLRAKFEQMSPTAFTCTVVNRAKRSGGEAHITFHNSKSRMGFGDISYSQERHGEGNSSHGSIRVEHDDYQMFLNLDGFMGSQGREKPKTTPEQAAEKLWSDFVQRAGIDYE